MHVNKVEKTEAEKETGEGREKTESDGGTEEIPNPFNAKIAKTGSQRSQSNCSGLRGLCDLLFKGFLLSVPDFLSSL